MIILSDRGYYLAWCAAAWLTLFYPSNSSKVLSGVPGWREPDDEHSSPASYGGEDSFFFKFIFHLL